MTPADFKALRLKYRMTVTEFAEYLGVNKSNVSRWESGVRAINGLTETAILARAAAGTKKAHKGDSVHAND